MELKSDRTRHSFRTLFTFSMKSTERERNFLFSLSLLLCVYLCAWIHNLSNSYRTNHSQHACMFLQQNVMLLPFFFAVQSNLQSYFSSLKAYSTNKSILRRSTYRTYITCTEERPRSIDLFRFLLTVSICNVSHMLKPVRHDQLLPLLCSQLWAHSPIAPSSR